MKLSSLLNVPFYTVKRKATDEGCDAVTKKPRLEEGTHCSVTKHDQSTLQVRKRGGWALFQAFPHLTMKEHPCHVCSKLDTFEANNCIYKEATSGFEVKS